MTRRGAASLTPQTGRYGIGPYDRKVNNMQVP